jgi:hypothetical protein
MTYTIYQVQAKLYDREIVFGVYSKTLEYAVDLAKKMFVETYNIVLNDGEYQISAWREGQ